MFLHVKVFRGVNCFSEFKPKREKHSIYFHLSGLIEIFGNLKGYFHPKSCCKDFDWTFSFLSGDHWPCIYRWRKSCRKLCTLHCVCVCVCEYDDVLVCAWEEDQQGWTPNIQRPRAGWHIRLAQKLTWPTPQTYCVQNRKTTEKQFWMMDHHAMHAHTAQQSVAPWVATIVEAANFLPTCCSVRHSLHLIPV